MCSSDLAGAIITLPGITEIWQAAAFIWLGGVIGFAVAGPELWLASAVVELIPPRGQFPGILDLREWPLYPGDVLSLGQAQVAQVGTRFLVYPPAGGLVANGHHIPLPRDLPEGGLLLVGRARYRVRVGLHQ